MDSSKTTSGVMDALKGRKGFSSKKGVSLLNIVQKLSKRRKEKGAKSDSKNC